MLEELKDFGHGRRFVLRSWRIEARFSCRQVRKRDTNIKSLREKNSQIWYKFVFEFRVLVFG